MEHPDDRLRLMFTCCHPALERDDQVALTLHTLGGLTAAEIARAFLLPAPVLAQRLERARSQIEEGHIRGEVLNVAQRLPSVQAVIYFVFNEGYLATTGDEPVRQGLCAEAVRLGRALCELLPNEAESLGLLALMLLQDSRRIARVRNQQLVTLEEQDRSLWDRGEIAEGLDLVEVALRRGPVGRYQLQAAIAALHAQAKTPDDTDWRQISGLYEKLLELDPSPVVALNQAVAVAMADGYEEGLKRIDAIPSSQALEGYHLFYAARADLLRRLNRFHEAARAYHRALALATNRSETDFLAHRLRQVEAMTAEENL